MSIALAYRYAKLRDRLTALFLATKTTNNPIALEAYTSAIPRTEPSDVLDLEFLVAQSLNFEFVVWHAHRALWGQWLDLQVSQFHSGSLKCSEPIQSLPQYESSAPDKAIYDNALTRLRASRLTDAELIYAPSQIALACLQLASPTLASEWLSSQSYQTDVSALLEPLAELIRTQGALPDVDAVREVDRRLKVCKNPEKVPGTRAFLAREDAETQAAADKRARKAAAAQSAMDAEDPFADPNGGNTTIVAAAAAATAGSQATEVEDDDDD
jgi:cyclin H